MNYLATLGTKRYILSLVCNDLNHSSGACFRSRQLKSIFQSHCWQLTLIDSSFHVPSKPILILLALYNLIKYGPLLPFSIGSLRTQALLYLYFRTTCRNHPNINGIILEGTGFGDLYLVKLFKSIDLKVILVPMNIESLVPGYSSWTHIQRNPSRRFLNEYKYWQAADFVFTISFEDSWFLGINNISSKLLPYFPDPVHLKKLQSIATQRSFRVTSGLSSVPVTTWLWISDFTNSPNTTHLSNTIKYIEQQPCLPSKLIICGRGSSLLDQSMFLNIKSNVELYGEITDQQLVSLLTTVTHLFICHPPTSGSLTRVVDSLIMGLPLISNVYATKNYKLIADCLKSGTLSPAFITSLLQLQQDSAEHHFLASL